MGVSWGAWSQWGGGGGGNFHSLMSVRVYVFLWIVFQVCGSAASARVSAAVLETDIFVY